MTWNWQYFSEIGYIGVLASASAILLWLIYWIKPGRLVATLALVLAVAGFVCAQINSESHVNRIQPDRSGEIARQKALEEAKRKAALDSRGSEVAQIRFAEDSAEDFLDHAGMDEADMKYFEQLGVTEVPEWMKEKKARSGAGADDDSIESKIGGEEAIKGVEANSEEEAAEVEPIIMGENDMVRANQIDIWNLKMGKILIGIGIFVLLLDYLRRANIYGKSSMALGLPSSWLNAVNPIPTVVTRPQRSRKPALYELAQLAKRGDSFIYLTNSAAAADSIPPSMPKSIFGRLEEVIRVTEDIDDDFVFEAAWYGRGSFVVDSEDRAQQMVTRILEKLELRKASRAKVSQIMHIVWDLDQPIAPTTLRMAKSLAKATGVSFFFLKGGPVDDRHSNPSSIDTAQEVPA